MAPPAGGGRIAAGLAGLVALAAIAACGSSSTVDTPPGTTARPTGTTVCVARNVMENEATTITMACPPVHADDTKARPDVTSAVGTVPPIGTTATTCVSAPASTAVGLPGGGEIVCSTNDTATGPPRTATTVPQSTTTSR